MSRYGTLIDNTLHPAWLVEQRDKSPLQTVKAIYQAIINKIDEKLEGGE